MMYRFSCSLLILNVSYCFYSDGLEDVKRKVMEAKTMLDLWKSSYLDTRAKIEASGRDSRWEFDRKKLFDKTDHMSVVCEDLYKVAQVIFKL
jgi:dynein heavy chain